MVPAPAESEKPVSSTTAAAAEKALLARESKALPYEGSELNVRATELSERLETAMQRTVDELTFWQRRLVTVVGVANTAAVLALGTAFIQAEDKAEIGRLVLPPLAYFVKGVVVAGASIVFEVINANVAYVYALNTRSPGKTPFQDRVAELILPVTSFLRAGCPAGSAAYFAFGLMEAIGVLRGVVAAG